MQEAAMANETVTIPENLRAKAKEKDWPDDLVQQALAAGATPEQLIGYLDQGITPDQARQFLAARPGASAGDSVQAGPSGELKAKAEKAGWPLELVEQALAMGAAEADLGRAICQICTNLSEKAQIEADVIGRWEPEISYGYHEVKLYLATVVFEDARAVEVFRKRALSNGGGLGLQAPGWGFRSVVDARNFTEMIAIQMVLQDSLTLAQYEYGEKYARNAAEKLIFTRSMQDKARHIAYGITHLKYTLMHRDDRREEFQRYLDKGEAMMVTDDKKDNAIREAFAIFFSGGKDTIRD